MRWEKVTNHGQLIPAAGIDTQVFRLDDGLTQLHGHDPSGSCYFWSTLF